MSDDDLADDGHDNHEPVLSQSKREETKQPEPVAPKVSKVKASKPVSEVKPEIKSSKPEVKVSKTEVKVSKTEVRASSKPPVKEKSIEKKEAPIEIKSSPIKDHDSSDDGRSKAKKKSKKRRHTSDQSDSEDHQIRKKKKKQKKNKESKKDKDEDDTKKQLQKILLDRLEKGDNDPKLLDLAMQLLGPEKTKPKAVSYFSLITYFSTIL